MVEVGKWMMKKENLRDHIYIVIQNEQTRTKR